MIKDSRDQESSVTVYASSSLPELFPRLGLLPSFSPNEPLHFLLNPHGVSYSGHMLTGPTREYIIALSDDRLVEYILSGTGLYQEEAIKFAREEFNRRELHPDRVAEISAIATARVRDAERNEAAAAAQPLDFWDKVNAFLWPLPFETLMAWVGDDIRGRTRQRAQRLRYAFLGMIFYVVFIASLVWLFR